MARERPPTLNTDTHTHPATHPRIHPPTRAWCRAEEALELDHGDAAESRGDAVMLNGVPAGGDRRRRAGRWEFGRRRQGNIIKRG
jgi:hypothetical protein